MNSPDDEAIAPVGRTAQREHEFARACFDWTEKDRALPCPGEPGRCRCYQHEPGVFVKTEVRLNVVTLGPPGIVRCNGSMTCSCESCAGRLRASIAQQRAARKRQPWEPKRHPRSLAA